MMIKNKKNLMKERYFFKIKKRIFEKIRNFFLAFLVSDGINSPQKNGIDIIIYFGGCLVTYSLISDIYIHYKTFGCLPSGPEEWQKLETIASILFRIRQFNDEVTDEDRKKYPDAPKEFDQEKANQRKKEKAIFDNIAKQFKKK
jgi:hypothetical protein